MHRSLANRETYTTISKTTPSIYTQCYLRKSIHISSLFGIIQNEKSKTALIEVQRGNRRIVHSRSANAPGKQRHGSTSQYYGNSPSPVKNRDDALPPVGTSCHESDKNNEMKARAANRFAHATSAKFWERIVFVFNAEEAE